MLELEFLIDVEVLVKLFRIRLKFLDFFLCDKL